MDLLVVLLGALKSQLLDCAGGCVGVHVCVNACIYVLMHVPYACAGGWMDGWICWCMYVLMHV